MGKSGLVLAAGLSSRYPAYKMIQKLDHLSILEHTILKMYTFVDDIIVVTGHRHIEIKNLLVSYKKVTCLYNENYESGMFSSIKKGVEMIHNDFYMIPGDCPIVKKETYDLLSQLHGDVIIPSYNMKAGHPILISKKLIPSLKQTDVSHMRAFLEPYKKTYATVDDSAVLLDIDTEREYLEIKRRFEHENY